MVRLLHDYYQSQRGAAIRTSAKKQRDESYLELYSYLIQLFELHTKQPITAEKTLSYIENRLKRYSAPPTISCERQLKILTRIHSGKERSTNSHCIPAEQHHYCKVKVCDLLTSIGSHP